MFYFIHEDNIFIQKKCLKNIYIYEPYQKCNIKKEQGTNTLNA